MSLMLRNDFHNCNLITHRFDASTFFLSSTVLCDPSIYKQPFLCSHAVYFSGMDIFSLDSLLDHLQQNLEAKRTPT